MYLWRCSIAITLGLIWYFSNCGRTVTQYFLCFFFCFSTRLLFGNSGRESSTQTDEESREKPLQVTHKYCIIAVHILQEIVIVCGTQLHDSFYDFN